MEMYEIKMPKEFESLERNRKDYERANLGVKIIEKFLLPQYRALLVKKMRMPSDLRNMRDPILIKNVNSGDATLEMQAERRVSKPSYEGIVGSWQAMLNNLNYYTQHRAITRVKRIDGRNFDPATETYGDLHGIANGSLEFALELNVIGKKGVEETDRIYIPLEIGLDTNSANAYINALNHLPTLKAFVKRYNAALNKKADDELTALVEVTQEIGYWAERIQKETPKYANVVKTLVPMDTEKPADLKKKRELELLADESIDCEERVGMFKGRYDLSIEHPYGKKALYVGIDSVLKRIEHLKEEKPTKTIVEKGQHQEMI